VSKTRISTLRGVWLLQADPAALQLSDHHISEMGEHSMGFDNLLAAS